MSTNPDFARSEGVAGEGNKGEKAKQGNQGGQSGPSTPGSQGQSGQRPGGQQGGAQTATNRLGAEVSSTTTELRDELGRVGQLAKDAGYEQWENLRDRGMEKARQIEDRIVDQPLKSVGIAVAVGFVLGLMWTRR